MESGEGMGQGHPWPKCRDLPLGRTQTPAALSSPSGASSTGGFYPTLLHLHPTFTKSPHPCLTPC